MDGWMHGWMVDEINAWMDGWMKLCLLNRTEPLCGLWVVPELGKGRRRKFPGSRGSFLSGTRGKVGVLVKAPQSCPLYKRCASLCLRFGAQAHKALSIQLILIITSVEKEPNVERGCHLRA